MQEEMLPYYFALGLQLQILLSMCKKKQIPTVTEQVHLATLPFLGRKQGVSGMKEEKKRQGLN